MNDMTTEYVKYEFSEVETQDISKVLAQKVAELSQMESDKKGVVSDFKGKIDTLQAAVNDNAHKITTGFEMRRVECEITADYENKLWRCERIDTGQEVWQKTMTSDDLQTRLDGEME